MELIYIWFEKHKNIQREGVTLDNDFDVKVTENGYLADEVVECLSRKDHLERLAITQDKERLFQFSFPKDPDINDRRAMIPCVKLEIKRTISKKFKKFYSENIKSITAIVGKNSVGKSNVLDCIGDTLNSLYSSSFILVYYDHRKSSYIIECNQISVDYEGNKIHAVKGTHQPKTKIVCVNMLGEISDYVESDLEYITISEKLDNMIKPNANDFCSSIPRFGLRYDRSNIYYAYKYLSNFESEENFNNNGIKVSFDLKEVRKQVINIVPDFFSEESSGSSYQQRKENYKEVFMLKFFEKVVNNFRILEAKEIQQDLDILKQLTDSINSNEELIANYSLIKQLIINMRSDLNCTSKENTVCMSKCYGNFIDDLERLVESLSKEAFNNTYSFVIDLKYGKSSLLEAVLEHFEDNDIDIEFKKTIDVSFKNVSDGLNYYLKLFSTIRTCMYRNKHEKFKSVILLLDEPEARFHPDLARCFIYDLSIFLKEHFSDLDFQVIITTHSPFILSDIISERVIKVSKDDKGYAQFIKVKENTFGADIHNLLKDAFFLKVTTGEFSRIFIRDIIDKVKPDSKGISPNLTKSEIAELHEKITIIAEPLVRNKLLSMLEKCTDSDTKLDFLIREMTRITKEIESIGG